MSVIRTDKYEEINKVQYEFLKPGDTFVLPGTCSPIYLKLTSYSVIGNGCISANILNGQTIDFDKEDEVVPVDLYIKYKYQEM